MRGLDLTGKIWQLSGRAYSHTHTHTLLDIIARFLLPSARRLYLPRNGTNTHMIFSSSHHPLFKNISLLFKLSVSCCERWQHCRLVLFASVRQTMEAKKRRKKVCFTCIFHIYQKTYRHQPTDTHLRKDLMHTHVFSSCFTHTHTSISTCSCTLRHMQPRCDKVASRMSFQWRSALNMEIMPHIAL